MLTLDSFAVAQIIGFIALGFTLALFQFNNRRTMLKISIVAAALYSIHFLLLGARTGALLNALSIARAATFLVYDGRKRPQAVMYIFIGLFLSVALITWSGWKTLLPIIAMVISTVAFWQLKTRRIRLLSLIAPPCWFIYNLLVGSYPGMVTEIVNLSSNSVGIWRFDIKRKHSLSTRKRPERAS